MIALDNILNQFRPKRMNITKFLVCLHTTSVLCCCFWLFLTTIWLAVSLVVIQLAKLLLKKATLLTAIRTLLVIFACLPVSTCTPERTFSTMKYIKNSLRNRMGEDRLSCLTLLFIHQKVEVEIARVIDTFSQKSRRLNFVV